MLPSRASPGKSALLADLRQRIGQLEGGGGGGAAVRTLGVPEIDALLPGGGLALGCLHEVAGAAPGDDGAAIGFAALLLSRITGQPGRILWLSQRRDLYPPGLAMLGLAPEPLILVMVRHDREVLWAMEEALRCPGLAAVLGEVREIDLVASRRLQLAAEKHGAAALLLRPPAPPPGASAAVTRWRLSGAAGATDDPPDLGASRWWVELARSRGGRPGRWLLEWRDGHLSEITDSVTVEAQRSSTTRLRPLALAS